MAGESAQEQYERLRDRRRASLRHRWPWMLGSIAAAGVAGGMGYHLLVGSWYVGTLIAVLLVGSRFLIVPQREIALRRGAEGERIVGGALDALEANGVRVLHDRKIPRSQANIDHIAVTPKAVFTVDAKRYRGKIAVRGDRLVLAGRDRSKLLEQARRQQSVVQKALADGGFHDVEVVPVLCFSGVEWPWLFPPRRVGEVRLCSPRGLRDTLGVDRDGGTKSRAEAIVAHLSRVLRPAGSAGDDLAVKSAPSAAKAPTPPPIPPPFFVPAVGSDPLAAARSEPSAVGDADAIPCACGAPMAVRTRRRDGTRFYGCSTFPQCRRTRPIEG